MRDTCSLIKNTIPDKIHGSVTNPPGLGHKKSPAIGEAL